jgi:Fe2+ transport system protein B
MYNALTGRSEKVGNWAGVTVDKKEHPIKSIYTSVKNVIAVDLPGAYSMSPFTNEESVTSTYVKNENPDVIINIVDASNLSRSLFFTTQLLELGIPVVVALNKSDVNEKKHTVINTEHLSQKLGCPVVETVSTSSDGLNKAIEEAPYLRDAYVERALLEYEQNNYKEVEKYCLKALKITKHEKTYINEPFSWDSTIYDLLAISCYYQKKYNETNLKYLIYEGIENE